MCCTQVLISDAEGWKMTTLDENKPHGSAPPFFQRILKTAWFHILILLLVLVKIYEPQTIERSARDLDSLLAKLQEELFEIRGQTAVLNREMTTISSDLEGSRSVLAKLQGRRNVAGFASMMTTEE